MEPTDETTCPICKTDLPHPVYLGDAIGVCRGVVVTAESWTMKAARQIRSEYRGCTEGPTQDRVAAIISTHAEPLIALLREARREHYHCDDSWYCCGKCKHPDHGELDTHDGEAPRVGGICKCGADAHNAKIDAVLKGV